MYQMKCFIKSLTKKIFLFLRIVYYFLKTVFKYGRVKIVEEPDREVVILGNGPSLNDIDLTKLKNSDVDVVCVNYFPVKNEYFWELKPKYIALLDPFLFYNENPKNPERRKELFDALEKVDWEIHIICFLGNQLPLKNKNIIYEKITTNTINSDYLTRFIDALYKKNFAILGAQNVTIGAGWFFVTKKVRKIYYAGIDMSEFKGVFVDEKNNVYVDAVHSYGIERVSVDYIKKGEFYKYFASNHKAFQQFYYLSEYAKRQNVKIINLSVNSYVDVFEKCSFDEIELIHKK